MCLCYKMIPTPSKHTSEFPSKQTNGPHSHNIQMTLSFKTYKRPSLFKNLESHAGALQGFDSDEVDSDSDFDPKASSNAPAAVAPKPVKASGSTSVIASDSEDSFGLQVAGVGNGNAGNDFIKQYVFFFTFSQQLLQVASMACLYVCSVCSGHCSSEV